MKKMIFGLAALASLATLATTVESSNTFGVLKLTSPDKETAICVPWVKVGTGASIDVDSLVLTSNLKAGDELYAFGKDSSNNALTYKWTLSAPSGSWGTSATTIGKDTEGTATKSSEYTIDRGLGLLLVRKNSDWTSEKLASTPIYLYGQHKDLASNEKTTTCPVSTDKALSTLIAPPSTAEVDLNGTYPSFTNAQPNDMIVTQLGTTYYYMYPESNHTQDKLYGYKWCKKAPSGETINWVASGVTIPAGRGAWYIAGKRPESGNEAPPAVIIRWAAEAE